MAVMVVMDVKEVMGGMGVEAVSYRYAGRYEGVDIVMDVR